MWVLIRREPKPDAMYWPGRRLLAVVDAVGWPLLWMLLLWPHVGQGGLLVAVVLAMAAICGVSRLRRAWWLNHRYRFTTGRWAKLVGALVLYGLLLRLVLGA